MKLTYERFHSTVWNGPEVMCRYILWQGLSNRLAFLPVFPFSGSETVVSGRISYRV